MSKLLRTFIVLTMTALLSPRPFLVRGANPEIRVTEGGQHAICERYTWLRLELAKRLPVDQPWPGPADIESYFAKYAIDKNAAAADPRPCQNGAHPQAIQGFRGQRRTAPDEGNLKLAVPSLSSLVSGGQ
jgi:hypothetical protein